MRMVKEQGWQERTVKVDTFKLLTALKENKEKHVKEYEEAVLGYKEVAKARLEAELGKAELKLQRNFQLLNAKIDQFEVEDQNDTVVLLEHVMFSMKVPQNHEKAYEVAIQMAEWEVGNTVELTQSQFQCFVLDDWDWKNEFEAVTKRYLSK